MQPDKLRKDIILKLDSEIYSAQAVRSAIYDLDIVADISLTGDNRRTIQIKLQYLPDSRASFKEKIHKAILDHQLRIDIEKETGPIRKLIVAQAFFPCENLDQLLNGLKL